MTKVVDHKVRYTCRWQRLDGHKHKNKHLLKIQSLAINMFGVIFFNSLLRKLYEYLCVLFKFKQVIWLIKKVIWLKLYMVIFLIMLEMFTRRTPTKITQGL